MERAAVWGAPYCRPREIEAVAATDVQHVAQAYFLPQNRYTALYRPVVTLSGAAIWLGVVLALALMLTIYRRWRRRRAQAREHAYP